jgi:hemolysin III
MGLSVLAVFEQLFAVAPASCYWIIAEGVCYIGGAGLYSIRKVRYMHSAFHFFVLAGSACHLVAVWYILAMI